MNGVRATIAALLTVAASGAQAAAAPSPAASASAGSLLQVLLGLVAVLALMAGAAWLLKRFGLAKSAGSSTASFIGRQFANMIDIEHSVAGSAVE